MRVQEVMTVSPQACRSDASANEAARIMWECDCGVVPVVDSADRVVGIVTDRDITMAAYFQGAPLSHIPIGSIMSPEVVTCSADADLSEAEHLMQEKQIHRVPIVDQSGCLVGIVSLSDVARGVKRSGGLRQRNGEAQELLHTVTAISEPRTQPRAPQH